jgi:hypothetical protein
MPGKRARSQIAIAATDPRAITPVASEMAAESFTLPVEGA